MTDEPRGPVRRGDVWLHHPEMGHVVWTGDKWEPYGNPPPVEKMPFWAKAIAAMFLIPLGVAGILLVIDLFVWVFRLTWRLMFG